MIRFCDKEVFCVKADQLDRGELFCYFLNGHREDMLCVIDDDGKYKGNITYTSLLNSDNISGSIQTAQVVLDENIWSKSRKYFAEYERLGDEIVMLPVVDENHQLLCFAYQDEDANREIRQLRELLECKNALTFHDIFSQYDLVTIWECNELAYYFAEYLRKIHMHVEVKGDFWEKLNYCQGVEYESLDYRNLNIYAEGTWEKCVNLREYLLRSVSVEFECIDIIYKKNIEKGLIKDAACSFDRFLQILKESDQIVITDTGEDALAACGLLVKNGIRNICFLTEENNQTCLIGGIPLYSLRYLRDNVKKVAFVECYSEHSVRGNGELDYYDYIGYHRNVSYFCIKDYISLRMNDIYYLLQEKDIVLTGDLFLCKRFYEYFKQEINCNSIAFYNILKDEKADKYHGKMPLIKKENIKKSDLFLIFAPEYSYSIKQVREINEFNRNNVKQQVYSDQLQEEGFYNFLFMHNEIPDNQINSTSKYSIHQLKPKVMIVGALIGDCGNVLLREILNGHDKILKIEYGLLNEHLKLFCNRLAGEKSEEILAIFWELVTEAVGAECIQMEFCDVAKFNNKMAEMLQLLERPTSQELFVIFHVAYSAMYGKEVSEVSNYIIYWEKHSVRRTIYPNDLKWLDAEGITGLVLTNCRNNLVRVGGLLKFLKSRDYFNRTDSLLFRTVLGNPDEWDEKESVWQSVEIKFEELKCVPQKIMDEIGSRVGVSFVDVLNHTIYSGQVNYDQMEQLMKPVYNSYDEFLSEFDKMRIAMITCEWQKKRNYPYVESEEITRKDLQEMYIREFRFEKQLVFHNADEYLLYRKNRQKWLRYQFSTLKFDSVMEDK